MVTQVTGGGELALKNNLDRYALQYNFISSQYHNSPADDFVDQNMGISSHFEGDIRNRLDLSANAAFAHYMRGTFLSQGDIASLISDPDQYHQYSANVNYGYGRTDAPGNLTLQAGWTKFDYINHLERTAQNDRNQYDVTPGFALRLMPKIYMTTQIQNTIVDYPNRQTGPENLYHFVSALHKMLNSTGRKKVNMVARQYAEKKLSKNKILEEFETVLLNLSYH